MKKDLEKFIAKCSKGKGKGVCIEKLYKCYGCLEAFIERELFPGDKGYYVCNKCLSKERA